MSNEQLKNQFASEALQLSKRNAMCADAGSTATCCRATQRARHEVGLAAKTSGGKSRGGKNE